MLTPQLALLWAPACCLLQSRATAVGQPGPSVHGRQVLQAYQVRQCGEVRDLSQRRAPNRGGRIGDQEGIGVEGHVTLDHVQDLGTQNPAISARKDDVLNGRAEACSQDGTCHARERTPKGTPISLGWKPPSLPASVEDT